MPLRGLTTKEELGLQDLDHLAAKLNEQKKQQKLARLSPFWARKQAEQAEAEARKLRDLRDLETGGGSGKNGRNYDHSNGRNNGSTNTGGRSTAPAKFKRREKTLDDLHPQKELKNLRALTKTVPSQEKYVRAYCNTYMETLRIVCLSVSQARMCGMTIVV